MTSVSAQRIALAAVYV